ncbi:MAG: PQQ-binding-like beta-propeller repeat protein, partial [Limisphaerales bacterium]
AYQDRYQVLDLRTGAVEWEQVLGDGFFGEFVVGNGVLYVVSEELDSLGEPTDYLRAMHVSNAAELWVREIPSEGLSDPHLRLSGGRLFRLEMQDIVAHSATSGEVLWRYADTEHPFYGEYDGTRYDMVALADRLILGQGHRVFSLDTATGVRQWATTVEPEGGCEEFETVLTSDAEHVVVGNVCGAQLVVLDAQSGTELWRDGRPRLFQGIPPLLAIADGLLYSVQRGVETFDMVLSVYRIATGEVVEEKNLGLSDTYTAFSVDGGYLYLAGSTFGQLFMDVYETQPMDLGLEVVDRSPCLPVVGSVLSYQYRVTNRGSHGVSDAVLEVSAGGARLDLVTPTGEVGGEDEIRYPLGELAAGASVLLDLSVVPLSRGFVRLNADVSGSVRDVNREDNGVSEVLSVGELPAGGVDLVLREMEVTQVIQNLSHEVPLIQGKPTLVRVYVDSGGVDIPGVQVLLHGERNGVALEGSPLLMSSGSPCGAVTALGPDRALLEGTLNFLLPRVWREGDVTLTAQVNADGFVPEEDLANNERSLSVRFVQQPPICIVAYPVKTADDSGDELVPNAFKLFDPALERIKNRALSLLPTDRIRIYPRDSVIEELQFLSWGPYEMGDDGDKSKILASLWVHDQLSDDPDACDDEHARTHYMGVIDPRSAGLGGWGGVALMGGDSLVVAMHPGGTGDYDFNAPRGGRTLAHELGHNYGRSHVDCGGPQDPDTGYPYDPCQLSDLDPAGYYGVDLLDPENIAIVVPEAGDAVSVVSDLMSYGWNRWTSDYTFKAIGRELSEQKEMSDWPSSALTTGVVDRSGGLQRMDLVDDSMDLYSTGEQLLVSGVLSLSGGVASFEVTLRLPLGAMSDEKKAALWREQAAARQLGSGYSLEQLDADGVVLSTQPFAPAETSDGGEGEMFVGVIVPYEPEAASIRVVQSGVEVLVAKAVSPNAPEVSVLAPVAGVTLDDVLVIEWVGSDVDGDDLTYTVQYSHDAGLSWEVLVVNTPETSHTASLQLLAGGDNTCLVQVIASDGVNTASAVSGLFSVAEHVPEVQIIQPLDGSSVIEGGILVVRGQALDAEDGFLEAGSLVWTLDGTEVVGEGEELFLDGLSVGTHTLNLMATDSALQQAAATVTFVVESVPEDPPTVVASYDAALNEVTLRWPASAGGFQLQQSSSPELDIWVDAQVEVTDEGATQSVTVVPTDTRMFYRLR